MKNVISQLTLVGAAVLLTLSASETRAEVKYSLSEAIDQAIGQDPWLHSSKLKQTAIDNRSIAAGALPDPQLSIGMMNLPTDTWKFDQEGMTQFQVGIAQALPRGDTLALKQAKLNIMSSQYPLLREARIAQIKSTVSQLWLDAYQAQKIITLINDDRALFEQMADVAKASYSNVIGQTRQQDVIRAQLELIQLEDRITVEQLKHDVALAKLKEWLHAYSTPSPDFAESLTSSENISVSDTLPHIELENPELQSTTNLSHTELARIVASHPVILVEDKKYLAARKDVALSEQAYKPQWAVKASYAYRDDMPSGDNRADLFSLGVTVDLPLFTENRQDKQLRAAILDSEAVKTDKLVLMKQMISEVEKELRQLNRLSEREQLYNTQLVSQSHDQAEAALTAYTNDDGDFAEVVRARISELNTKIAALTIKLERLKTIARLNYFLTPATTASHAPEDEFGASQ